MAQTAPALRSTNANRAESLVVVMRKADHPAILVRGDDARRRVAAEHDPAHRLAVDAHPVTLKFILRELKDRQRQFRPIWLDRHALLTELGALLLHPIRDR